MFIAVAGRRAGGLGLGLCQRPSASGEAWRRMKRVHDAAEHVHGPAGQGQGEPPIVEATGDQGCGDEGRRDLLPRSGAAFNAFHKQSSGLSVVVLDGWQRRGRATRVGGVLWLDDERVHDVVDAVRVLGRRNGESDPYGWSGRVFPLRELLRLGAELGPEGCKIGSAS